MPVALGLLIALITACSDKSTQPSPGSVSDMSLNEPLVTAVSEAYLPVRTDGYARVYDLSGDSMVSNGSFNDIIISRDGFINAEPEYSVYNFQEDRWDRFAPTWDMSGITNWVMVCYDHSLLAKNLLPREYLNDSLQAMVYCDLYILGPPPSGDPPQLYVVSYNSGYHPTRLLHPLRPRFGGLVHTGDGYLVRGDDGLYPVSEVGQFATCIDFPSNGPVTGFDGQSLWMCQYGSAITYRISLDGDTLCLIHLPFDQTMALAAGNDRLWAAGRQGDGPTRIYEIDLDSSCLTGQALFTDSIIYDERTFGMEWSSGGLLLYSDSLRVMSFGGVIEHTYPLPVSGILDIDWRNGVLHVLCGGPAELGLDEQVIVRFSLP